MDAYQTTYLVFTGMQVLVAGGGFIAVWRSLHVLGQQAELLRESIEESACISVGDRQLQIDRIFIEWPTARKYFLDGIQITPQDADYTTALAIAQLMANYFESYFLQRKNNRSQLYPEDTWLKYIDDHLVRSPILRQFILGCSGWYTGDLVEAARAADSKANLINTAAIAKSARIGERSMGRKPKSQPRHHKH